MAQQQGTTRQTAPNSTFFDDPTFSDLTIKLDGRDVMVHYNVLVRTSQHLGNLLTEFSESHPREILLHDDKPEAVVSVLRYLYGLPYETAEAKWHDGVSLIPHVQVYLAAGKYQARGLQDEVERKMSSILANNNWSDAGHDNRVFELTGFLRALCAMISRTCLSDRRGRALFVQHCVNNKTEFKKNLLFTTSVSTNVRELWGEIILCEHGEQVIDPADCSEVSNLTFNVREFLAYCEEKSPR